MQIPVIGEVISHYKILEKLGEGGMGVLYKAEDTRLQRTVALKFLPPELTRDPDAKKRFILEAQAASALQHANICVVYDIDETSDGHLFISMEYLEGESLRKKIERGPLTTDEAIDIALQVSQGLAKAHEHGIVHRDIKPANLMVTVDGAAKIVDFGIAKLSSQVNLTKTGSTLGTAAYMSPEQSEGGAIDHRTDIWSLGVVLYETLTGHLPFRGEHEAALLYSIVNTEPTPIAQWRQDIPPALETLIDRALEKDPTSRCQTATEFAAELRRIQRRSDRVTTEKASAAAPVRRRTGIVLAITAAVLAAAGTWLLISRLTPDALAVNPDMGLRPLNVHFPEIGRPAVSADGNWIVFPACDENGKWNLYFMNAAGSDVRAVPTDTIGERIIDIDISPDGSWLAFSRWELRKGTGGSSVYLVPVIGGTPRRVDGGLSARWRPDGRRLGYVKHPPFTESASGNREFWTASSDGRDPLLEFADTSGVKSFGIVPFAWSSNGKEVVWGRAISERAQELFLRDLETGRERPITGGKSSIIDVAWVRDGAVAYVTDKSGFYNLWVVDPDGGQPLRVTHASLNQVGVDGSNGGGRLLTLQRETSWSLHAAAVNSPRPQTLFSGELWIGHFDPSPDGTEIAWETREEGKNKIIVSLRNGSDRREIAQSDSAIAGMYWSPDGRMLAYGVVPAAAVTSPHAADSSLVFVVDPHALEDPRFLTTGIPITWADSATVLVLRDGRSWLQPADGSRPEKFFRDSVFAFPVVGMSYAVYFTRESDGRAMWIARADGSDAPRRLQRTEEGDDWAFSPDNRFITVLSISRSVFRMHFPDGRIEPLRVPQPDISDSPPVRFRISRNGQEVFYTRQRGLYRLVLLDKPFLSD